VYSDDPVARPVDRGRLASLNDVTVVTDLRFAFDNSFVRDLPGLFVQWPPTAVGYPELLALNEPLAAELGLAPAALRSPAGVAVLAGNALPDGAAGVAQAYAGHQFGNYVPRLGDGRALLLGELIDVSGRRRDLHFKGSGPTPYARGGDGRAAIGPMLREYLVGEGMHALGIPTTRALAVVATGQLIARDGGLLPGAVLTRVASSHLRVGSFQYARSLLDHPGLLRRLADHAIARHYRAETDINHDPTRQGNPDARAAENPYLALLSGVISAQAALVARWMTVGFVHGVLNTDNVTISGETIDYGPCAFIDAFDPGAVFSSIDETGRYAYRNQPPITLWNVTRLAEALLPLIDDEDKRAVELARSAMEAFAEEFEARWMELMRAKLALADPGDAGLVREYVALLAAARGDWTGSFRALSAWLRGADGPLLAIFADPAPVLEWAGRWRSALPEPIAAAAAMDAVNPLYIPRNHLVEAALAAATEGDLALFHKLLDAVTRPFDARPGLEGYESAAPPEFGRYRTFCGT
jgi:uncharacterized protein YdiU (UPF0061 family)